MPERFKVVFTMQGAIQVLGFTFTFTFYAHGSLKQSAVEVSCYLEDGSGGLKFVSSMLTNDEECDHVAGDAQ